MTKEVLGRCPICGNELELTRLSCGSCESTIEGHFHLCKFCRLAPEQKNFIDIFIKCRGNIKEVEKELGVSYPTVKNRLEDVATALGHRSEPDSQPNKKKEILDRLNAGEINVEEAIEMMKNQG